MESFGCWLLTESVTLIEGGNCSWFWFEPVKRIDLSALSRWPSPPECYSSSQSTSSLISSTNLASALTEMIDLLIEWIESNGNYCSTQLLLLQLLSDEFFQQVINFLPNSRCATKQKQMFQLLNLVLNVFFCFFEKIGRSKRPETALVQSLTNTKSQLSLDEISKSFSYTLCILMRWIHLCIQIRFEWHRDAHKSVRVSK